VKVGEPGQGHQQEQKPQTVKDGEATGTQATLSRVNGRTEVHGVPSVVAVATTAWAGEALKACHGG